MLRPSRVHPPAIVTAALAAAFFGISRTSGSGWATVLVAMLLGGLFTGVLAPISRLVGRPMTLRFPTDATVSLPMWIEVVARGGTTAEVSELGTGRFRAEHGTVAVCPVRRGTFRKVTVFERSDWPLGLVEWQRSYVVTLPASLDVGPLPADADIAPGHPVSDTGDEDLRGIRAYRPGDSSRRLHWPATARTGELMIRETDSAVRAPFLIVVDLNGPHEAVEPTVSRAAGLALAALAQGCAVILATAEEAGPATRPATSPIEVSRRLARAVVGPTDPALIGQP